MVTPKKEIERYVKAELEKRKKLLIKVLDTSGEIAIKDQTLVHKYLNQTGNLSSSIGYIVLDNGKVVSGGGFTKQGDGETGVSEGENFIKLLIADNRQGLVLIVVAGMNYAIYVETMGLDVLTTAQLVSSRMVKKLIKQL